MPVYTLKCIDCGYENDICCQIKDFDNLDRLCPRCKGDMVTKPGVFAFNMNWGDKKK